MNEVDQKEASACLTCGGSMPETNLNKFYCSEHCRIVGWRKHNPDKEEPDWDEVRREAYGRLIDP